MLLRLVVATAGLVGSSGTVGAHGSHGFEGEPVTFAVVLGLPIVAALGGGAIAIGRLRGSQTAPTGHRVGVVLGVSLAVLGVTFAASAATTSRTLGLAGGVIGGISVLGVTRGDKAPNRGCHADLALGAVSVHRLLEGLALGALYSAGAAVGLLGAVLLAGHMALETAAVGGLYATTRVRTEAVGAILLVQTGYAGGAVVGLGVADLLPVWTSAVVLAIAGGALIVVGVGETERSIAAARLATA